MHPLFRFNHSISKLISGFKKTKANWEITDTIVKIEDIVKNQYPDFIEGNKFPYICLRSYNMTCLYVREDQFDTFRNMDFYYEREQLINITQMLRYVVKEDCYSQVLNKSMPIEVRIKQVETCSANKILFYITRVIELKDTTKLFIDLTNYQIMKDKTGMK